MYAGMLKEGMIILLPRGTSQKRRETPVTAVRHSATKLALLSHVIVNESFVYHVNDVITTRGKMP